MFKVVIIYIEDLVSNQEFEVRKNNYKVILCFEVILYKEDLDRGREVIIFFLWGNMQLYFTYLL